MTEQTDKTAGGSALDWLWLAAALALVVGGLGGLFRVDTQPTPARGGAGLPGGGLGVGAFGMSSVGRTVWQFALASRVELRKMVWPSIDETRKTTLVVF